MEIQDAVTNGNSIRNSFFPTDNCDNFGYIIHMDNFFINLIDEGKIKNIDDLKKAFRKVAKKTHPDSVGSDRFVRKFVIFRNFYEEAKKYLGSKKDEKKGGGVPENFRYLFFKELSTLDALELPHNRNDETEERIRLSAGTAYRYFREWRIDRLELYVSANVEYEKIRNEKFVYSLSNLRKVPFHRRLVPVFFNLCNYHMTGLEFYKRQIERMLAPVLDELDEKKYESLKCYLLFLTDDMKNGPAVFDGT
jgi:hypothetical protein